MVSRGATAAVLMIAPGRDRRSGRTERDRQQAWTSRPAWGAGGPDGRVGSTPVIGRGSTAWTRDGRPNTPGIDTRSEESPPEAVVTERQGHDRDRSSVDAEGHAWAGGVDDPTGDDAAEGLAADEPDAVEGEDSAADGVVGGELDACLATDREGGACGAEQDESDDGLGQRACQRGHDQRARHDRAADEQVAAM